MHLKAQIVGMARGSDLQQISEYIEQDRSLESANRIARAIYDAAQSLRTLPDRGCTASELTWKCSSMMRQAPANDQCEKRWYQTSKPH